MIGASIGAFELGAELGRGGVGVVYEARHRTTGEAVALKLPRPELGELARARVAREAVVLRGLRHRSIVGRVAAGSTCDGVPWLALERLSGADLRATIRDGVVTERMAARVAHELLSALEVVHECGVVHRDVKPANVFRCHDGTLRLLDFGVAHAPLVAPVERPGAYVGSPRFMAPEQLESFRVDARADLYALGLLVFELLVGCGPFDAFRGSFSAMRHAHLHVEPQRLGPLVDVSPGLDAVVGRALQKRPVDRFGSARSMRLALEAAYPELPRAWPHARGTHENILAPMIHHSIGS